MHTLKKFTIALTVSLIGAGLVNALLAEDKKAPPSQEELAAQYAALGKPGPNHQLLGNLVGTWDSKATFQLAPGAPPSVSLGTTVRRALMGGRYFETDTTAHMQMPGPDGKMHEANYQGMEIDGYDNAKQKFFSTWIDSMGTGYIQSEGTYDPASKTFTYHLEEEAVPGQKTQVRTTLKVIDSDHYVYDWYEEHGDKEDKTMEITYARRR